MLQLQRFPGWTFKKRFFQEPKSVVQWKQPKEPSMVLVSTLTSKSVALLSHDSPINCDMIRFSESTPAAASGGSLAPTTLLQNSPSCLHKQSSEQRHIVCWWHQQKHQQQEQMNYWADWISWFYLVAASGPVVAQLLCMCRPKNMTFQSVCILQDHHWSPTVTHHLSHTPNHNNPTPLLTRTSHPPPPLFPKLINHKALPNRGELLMEEQVSAPRTHSANEPNEPTAGSDGIEGTSEEDHHPTLHFVIAHWYSSGWGDLCSVPL